MSFEQSTVATPQSKGKEIMNDEIRAGGELVSQDVSVLQDRPIKLQVGERHFETTASTLRESKYFAALLSNTWHHCARADGSFFVDGDGDLFEHILRYLRRLVLPIFYDNAKGHDEVLYSALLEEAKFYGINRLVKWIEEKRYVQSVRVVVSSALIGRGDTPEYRRSRQPYDLKDPEDAFQPEPGAEVTYYPCVNAVTFFGLAKVTKKTVIDRKLCLGEWDE